jgi:hypothetical protein
MRKKHKKSVCCGLRIIKFGSKRRQCVGCKKTWRIWKKKVGRKKKRISTELVKSFFRHEISSMSFISRKKSMSESFVQKEMIKSRDLFVKKTSWQEVPDGDLLLIADAVVEMVENKWRTIYLILARSIKDSQAIILPPFIISFVETPFGWHQAFENVPPAILGRVRAVVCDGHRGILYEARDRNWIVQRCHFHLIARIQSRRSRYALSRNKEESKKIFNHVGVVLKSTEQKEIQKSLNILEEIGWISKSREIRTTLNGFATNYKNFRSYIDYPELNLPITSNTAESLASTIADLKRRMRGFPTMNSFEKWIIALLKFRQNIKCNKYQPN